MYQNSQPQADKSHSLYQQAPAGNRNSPASTQEACTETGLSRRQLGRTGTELRFSRQRPPQRGAARGLSQHRLRAPGTESELPRQGPAKRGTEDRITRHRPIWSDCITDRTPEHQRQQTTRRAPRRGVPESRAVARIEGFSRAIAPLSGTFRASAPLSGTRPALLAGRSQIRGRGTDWGVLACHSSAFGDILRHSLTFGNAWREGRAARKTGRSPKAPARAKPDSLPCHLCHH